MRTTPVLTCPILDEIAGAELLIKAESLQETGSFKLRGALNRLLQIPDDQRAAGVVAFSSGNHAQGISRAARYLSMPALIVMPADAPAVKTAAVLADGAEIYAYDRQSESREEIAAKIASERGAVLVPSFDDPDIIAGQGTVGLEFAQQVAARADKPLDYLICCTGGGGLISGIALAFEQLSPSTRIITAEPDGFDDWRQSLAAGRIIPNSPGAVSACDAILTPAPGRLTWAIGKRLLHKGITVTDAQVFEAMRAAFTHLNQVTEPGGCAALAIALYELPEEAKGKKIGVVITGGNVDPDAFSRIVSA
ncbi:MAG: threonine/serine dehydratase [Henriciella sp.]